MKYIDHNKFKWLQNQGEFMIQLQTNTQIKQHSSISDILDEIRFSFSKTQNTNKRNV